jgi:phosphoenolpyruvate-protein kinase (PTS system EI component)
MGVPDGDVRIPGLKNLPEGSIVVAHDLSPSLMLHIRKNCAGIVTEEGGVTGHMAILAKSRGIPALVHVPQLMKLVRAGDVLLLDATEGSGRLLLHPSNAEIEAYHVYTRALPGPSSVSAHSPIALPDGSEARIWLNLDDLPDEANEEDDARKLEVTGVSGVGLFRTEFLYLKDTTLLIQPDRHTECYYRLFTGPLNGLPLTLRLLDMGDDKGYPPQSAVKDRDLRGVRFLLANPTILDSQLRAIFTAVARAGLVDNQCRLMVPVVSRFEEMEAMRECVMRLREEIERDSGARLPEVPLGMMLETPAAALMCEIFASNSAFFSIGSNDLTRLALGVDRDNTLPRDELFYQPALFRMIELVRNRITVPLAVCGEIAGRPDVLSILIGLGVRDFSVAPASLARCFERLAGFDADSFARCHDQARRVCQAHTAADVRALVSS